MRWQALLGMALLGLGLAGGPALGGTPCRHVNLQLAVNAPRDADDICEGAARAVAFFRQHQLQATKSITLIVADRLPPGQSASAAGVYLSKYNQIHMLSFNAFQQFQHWFHTPITREVYRSLAAHEVAHAITDEHFQIHQPSVHAREYLAYVALFSSMPVPLREQVLEALPGQVVHDESRLSLMVYLMDPMYFGAQSYRHFINLSAHERQAFVQAVLNGRVFVD